MTQTNENTPDTEWKIKVRNWWYSMQDIQTSFLPEHKRAEVEQIIKEAISSRDTYWNERVFTSIEREKEKAEPPHIKNNYKDGYRGGYINGLAKAQEILQALDNLK